MSRTQFTIYLILLQSPFPKLDEKGDCRSIKYTISNVYGTHMRVLYHFCCCQSHSSEEHITLFLFMVSHSRKARVRQVRSALAASPLPRQRRVGERLVDRYLEMISVIHSEEGNSAMHAAKIKYNNKCMLSIKCRPSQISTSCIFLLIDIFSHTVFKVLHRMQYWMSFGKAYLRDKELIELSKEGLKKVWKFPFSLFFY